MAYKLPAVGAACWRTPYVSFTDNCVTHRGARDNIRAALDARSMLVTALAPKIGYDNAAKIAKRRTRTAAPAQEAWPAASIGRGIRQDRRSQEDDRTGCVMARRHQPEPLPQGQAAARAGAPGQLEARAVRHPQERRRTRLPQSAPWKRGARWPQARGPRLRDATSDRAGPTSTEAGAMAAAPMMLRR